jgi:hypothetical protein
LKSDDLASNLLEALREELKEYGEMLVRLEHQQEQVMARNGNEVLGSVDTVNQQASVIQQARQKRELAQAILAEKCGLPGKATFEELAGKLPELFCFPITSLVKENNELLRRVQKRARQNHLLLVRSVELMQGLITNLLPGAAPKTYTGAAQLQGSPMPSQSLFEGVA